MSYRVDIRYRGHFPRMPKSKLNGVLRESYEAVGEQFFDQNLPRRFTQAGAFMLGYRKRAPRTIARKKALGLQNLPLVSSGVTRQRALSKSFTRIVARSTKGEGKLELRVNAPALNFRNPKGPNMREEFERIAQREVGPLERTLETSVDRRLESYNEPQIFKAG